MGMEHGLVWTKKIKIILISNAFANKTRGHLKDSESTERIVTLGELGKVPKLSSMKKGASKSESTEKN